MVGTALDALAKEGDALPGSEVAIALSSIGMAVRAGAPVPDISTLAKLRQVLPDAKSVACSDGASGVYLQDTLFKTHRWSLDGRPCGRGEHVKPFPGSATRRER